MKPKFTFITQFAVCAVATTLACTAAYGQNEPATSGDDVSGHPTTDSPYLRARAKPAASAAQQQATKLSQKDQQFLSHIAAGGAQAVADSKVAEQQGGASVKNAASRIVSERSKSNAELQALAKKKGLGLGMDKFKPRSMGKSNFDKQFVHTMSRDLQEDVRLLQTAANSSDDKDIKAWAAKTLPSVKGQLNALQAAGGKG
jgi:putative membrane protein